MNSLLFSVSLVYALLSGKIPEDKPIVVAENISETVRTSEVKFAGVSSTRMEFVYDYELNIDGNSAGGIRLPFALVYDYPVNDEMNGSRNMLSQGSRMIDFPVSERPINLLEIFNQEKERLKVPGIIYNETSGVYPALKDDLKPNGIAHWDFDSREQLNKARQKIALIANDGRKKMASPFIPNERSLSANGREQWKDCMSVAGLVEGQKCSDEHFVIWPSTDGKFPTDNPRITAKWPYDHQDKIHDIYGPFRVPVQVGDVPAGDNIYIFFYKGVP